ncbi:dienelactone hydrolase [Phialemonium atrogriseum]|uniref:Dienelactone hydrolase n=1 Tax=Phialemonium atrogriseum TaxID=1093897 RepID=A0AAJ0BSE8_9PEZI|nr:dienelactone hydrolase [Phialemonium atrogriseum]KAK1763643.1 dienelactone hydrolase [Phialemonium atrogriseum]
MSCPDCFSGAVHEGIPRGKVIKFHDLNTYITEPADGREVKNIIVIIPDAFGWEFVNNRILADHYADKGHYRVYLPDFMLGHASPLWMIGTMRTLMNPGNVFKKLYAVPIAIYGIAPFLFFNRQARSYPIVKKFFAALRKNEGANLSVGAAGFCWGGKLTVLLAADADLVDGKPLIDAGFTGHPSRLDIPAEIEAIKKPVSFACAENDSQLPKEQADKIAAIVEAKGEGEKGEVVWYAGCGHGFCVRADSGFEDVAKQAAEAEDQCIRWFDSHFIQ